MKKVIPFILTILMCFTLAGCGGNDNNKETSSEKPTSIVGNWECDNVEITDSGKKVEKETVKSMVGDDFSDVLQLVAYSDGSADMTLMGDNASVSWSETNNLEYKISYRDSKDNDSDDISAKLTGDNLIITIKDTYSSDGETQTMEMEFTMNYLGGKSKLLDGWDVDPTDDEIYAMSNAMVGGCFVEAGGLLYGDYGGKEWGAGSFTAAKLSGSKLGEMTVIEKNVKASSLSVYDGNVYGILDNNRIVKIEVGKTEATTLYKGTCASLQVTSDGLFFTDKNSRYCKVDFNGKNKETILDKEIYYPYQVNSSYLVYQDDADGETLHVYNLKDRVDAKITHRPSYEPILRGEYIYFYTPGSGENMNYVCRVNMYSGKEEQAKEESLLYAYYLTPDNIIAAMGGFVKVEYDDWDKFAKQNSIGMKFYPAYSNGEIWITKSSGENYLGPKTFGTDDEKSIGYTYMKE